MLGGPLADVASALAVETRAEIVAVLMDGTAHTGTELARHIRVAPSTASEHLGVLVDAGLVTVKAQGRHRYFRLASRDVARLVETLVAAAPAPPRPRGGVLDQARICYDHLAGFLAVQVFDRLLDVGGVDAGADGVALTACGRAILAGLGVDLPATSVPVVRTCLDWTERREHLGGTAGARLLETLLARGWLRHCVAPRRRLEVTAVGYRGFQDHLGLELV